ncbi:MAG: hypothetical protein ABI690_04755 [Chloroflexota bacterium]
MTGAENTHAPTTKPADQRTPYTAAPDSLDQETPLPSLVQQMKLDRRLLTPANILQLQRTIGNAAVQRLISSTRQEVRVQRYSQQQVGDADIESHSGALWRTREDLGFGARGDLGKNAAFEIENRSSNQAMSKSNTHAEPQILMTYLSKGGGDNDFQISSERKPCGECEADLRKQENNIKVNRKGFKISVHYLVPYTETQGDISKNALTWLYLEQDKIEPYRDEVNELARRKKQNV